jgi:hypothetical protein
MAFEWDRCHDANLFAYYVKKRLAYATEWRVTRITKELPTVQQTETLDHDTPRISLNDILNTVEEHIGSKFTDMLFCMFGLRMSQEDTGKVFGVSQKAISIWWRELIPKMRELLQDIPGIGAFIDVKD